VFNNIIKQFVDIDYKNFFKLGFFLFVFFSIISPGFLVLFIFFEEMFYELSFVKIFFLAITFSFSGYLPGILFTSALIKIRGIEKELKELEKIEIEEEMGSDKSEMIMQKKSESQNRIYKFYLLNTSAIYLISFYFSLIILFWRFNLNFSPNDLSILITTFVIINFIFYMLLMFFNRAKNML